ncbi:MAG: hypothetical protein QNJ09_05345, partial [Paracoccaceae bacterium]|nr:hypothetical protein [Paracoccaceae bacterium]
VPPLRDPVPVTPTAVPAPDAAAPAPQANNPLRQVRPEARPEDLLELRERATLGGISVAELRAIRPTMRPRTAQEDAQEAEPESPATDQAVVRSLAPVTRPRNMAAIVRRAEQARPQEVRTAAAVAPRTVTPDIPSAASVTRAATERNAINLNRVNLIGVYGKPSSRRALVRLANGQYKKVQVGDRMDGGRVTAIGESELRYSKRGRNVVLKMPRG